MEHREHNEKVAVDKCGGMQRGKKQVKNHIYYAMELGTKGFYEEELSLILERL